MAHIRNFVLLDDRAVVSLARLGDKAAYSELVRRHQSWIRNLLRRLCGNAALADDLGQQVFLAAWLGLAQLRTVEAFPGWLRMLAVRGWLKHCRRKNPLHAAADVDDVALAAADSSTAESIDIECALATLSDAERVCIVLCYHEGLSHTAVAELVALPLGTVKSHVLRGRQKLQAYLSAYAIPDPSTSGAKTND